MDRVLLHFLFCYIKEQVIRFTQCTLGTSLDLDSSLVISLDFYFIWLLYHSCLFSFSKVKEWKCQWGCFSNCELNKILSETQKSVFHLLPSKELRHYFSVLSIGQLNFTRNSKWNVVKRAFKWQNNRIFVMHERMKMWKGPCVITVRDVRLKWPFFDLLRLRVFNVLNGKTKASYRGTRWLFSQLPQDPQRAFWSDPRVYT